MENQEKEIISMPRIGDKAPQFKAVTTQGEINFPADYEGKWTILFSHPADFTPVCTSEFMTFAHLQDKFQKANCELVGLSVDGLYSHIAWLRTIKDKVEFNGMKNIEVTFPLKTLFAMASTFILISCPIYIFSICFSLFSKFNKLYLEII